MDGETALEGDGVGGGAVLGEMLDFGFGFGRGRGVGGRYPP